VICTFSFAILQFACYSFKLNSWFKNKSCDVIHTVACDRNSQNLITTKLKPIHEPKTWNMKYGNNYLKEAKIYVYQCYLYIWFWLVRNDCTGIVFCLQKHLYSFELNKVNHWNLKFWKIIILLSLKTVMPISSCCLGWKYFHKKSL
jgi:hypothetical protein